MECVGLRVKKEGCRIESVGFKFKREEIKVKDEIRQ
jgi:hypothetical protein